MFFGFHNRTITIINEPSFSTPENEVKSEFESSFSGVDVKTIIQPVVVTKPVDNKEAKRDRIKELFLKLRMSIDSGPSNSI